MSQAAHCRLKVGGKNLIRCLWAFTEAWAQVWERTTCVCAACSPAREFHHSTGTAGGSFPPKNPTSVPISKIQQGHPGPRRMWSSQSIVQNPLVPSQIRTPWDRLEIPSRSTYHGAAPSSESELWACWFPSDACVTVTVSKNKAEF